MSKIESPYYIPPTPKPTTDSKKNHKDNRTWTYNGITWVEGVTHFSIPIFRALERFNHEVADLYYDTTVKTGDDVDFRYFR